MAEISITINGRNYGIACDDGQERRVQELARYVDSRLRDIARSGAATNETHLLVLTTIILADEIADMKASGMPMAAQQVMPVGVSMSHEDEAAIVSAIDLLASRIDSIAGSLQKF
jgi:cell division protein ZapA